MPGDQFRWQRRIKAVEREHAAVRLAIDRLWEVARGNPSDLRRDVTLADIGNASGRLDGTYLIRLFAEFETGLRLFWSARRSTPPPSRTRDLLDGVAATCQITFDVLTNAQDVREYRNALVHEREEATAPISIAEARRRLCHYFSFLPPGW
jgi:hypothetical protein